MTPDEPDQNKPTVPDQRRRYPAPTIDLAAMEIRKEPASDTAHATSPDAAASSASDSAHAETIAQPVASVASRGDDEPPQETASAGGRGDPPWRRWPPIVLPFPIPWPLLGAGAAGGAVVLLLMLVLWSTGLFSSGEGTRALAERMARIEQQGAAANAAGLANRIAAAEASLKSLANDAANLNRRVDDVGDAARAARERSDTASRALAQIAQNSAAGRRGSDQDVEDLSRRVNALEAATKATQSQLAAALAKSSGATSDDRAVRFAVFATALRIAVERGQSFAPELAQAKRFIADPNRLEALEPFAAQGVPTPAALARELDALAPALLKAADVPNTDGNFLTRLRTNAEHLVRIRPLDETPGDEPANVILRIELKSAHGDIPGALAEFGKLPEAVRAPAEAWIKKAQARESAIALARQIAADALTALAASAG